MTKDGRLILIHDESLARTTGSDQLVKDVLYEQLLELDAGSWFDPQFANERIPTLEQLLELVQHTETIVNIELKNGIVQYPQLEQRLIETVRTYEMTDRVIISSFNHYSLLTCKQLAPEIRTGILYMEGLYRPWEYAATVQADALHPFKYAVRPEWVAEAAAHHIAYHPFTVNTKAEMKQLLQAGVAGIITDFPDLLAEVIAGEE